MEALVVRTNDHKVVVKFMKSTYSTNVEPLELLLVMDAVSYTHLTLPTKRIV